ncbi:transmembrane reductase CYB561D2 isoform X2 [Gadus macrocephalus]|nr:transmembrane reductase CYB561D2 isoform X2 [Gadus macrocephalus]XP_059924615.1 transmembrane reductase CYB561D2 isoform X2 [Gadus macrocephalus]XP_059924616.1 transmembrane reductase CYB561D2 isoform X2 [Gadus macrocephalus]XP_059924617.1 transmembrane reductase CYB561D2 isoform X2 [Gadus macrocephalus]
MDAQPGTYGYTRAACTILTHLVCTIFTILITVLSRPGSSLFSWHPFLMTLAFSFFMTEAILVFSPHGSPFRMFPHKSKGRLHWVLQCLGLACAALGFVAIVYNKHLAGKAHFTSWHGLTGLVTVCVVGIQCLAAVSLIYPSLVKGWSLAKLKRYHAAAGLLTYLLGGGSLFLGVSSVWFTASVGELAWYLTALCPVLSSLVIMSQVSNAYMAKKRLQS